MATVWPRWYCLRSPTSSITDIPLGPSGLRNSVRRCAPQRSAAVTLLGGTFAPMEAKLVVRLLDELAGRATAPSIVEPLDGWQLRASPDAPFRRANSVLPNGDLAAGTDLEDAITTVEQFYEARELPARFQLSSAARPEDLDHVLEQRGYEIEAPVVVMCAGATIVLGRTDGAGRVTE